MNKELEELRGITKNKIEYIKRQPEIDWVYLNYYEGVLNLVDIVEALDNTTPIEALEGLKTPLHNEWLRFYPQFKEMDETTKIVDGCRMVKSDANNYLVIKQALVEAQETEKKNAEYKELEEQFGGQLNMILNLMKNSNTLDEHCHTQDIYFDYKGKLISGSFVKLEYDNEFIINVETSEMFDSSYDIDDYDLKVKDYKKTWWLKEDRSE